ncbi:MAG: shikimate kinase AroK [Gammaproteobacteria bacterium]|nr:shikimate kinase AroK [Gammaproteobacteria bacterium]
MTVPDGNFFLVGPMGAGKTTIGRRLARELGKDFIDSDQVIEERTGASIPLIFELEGEAGFRRREKAILEELTSGTDLVVATGGGVVLDRENRSILINRGFVIYLHAPLERLFERTRRNRNRPLLQTKDPQTKIRDITAERDPLYRQVADLTVKTDHRTIQRVVKEIQRHLIKL